MRVSLLLTILCHFSSSRELPFFSSSNSMVSVVTGFNTIYTIPSKSFKIKSSILKIRGGQNPNNGEETILRNSMRRGGASSKSKPTSVRGQKNRESYLNVLSSPMYTEIEVELVKTRRKTLENNQIKEKIDNWINAEKYKSMFVPRKEYVRTFALDAVESTSIPKKKNRKVRSFDAALFFTYVCSMFTITAPVVLIPIIAGDPSMYDSKLAMFSSVSGASFAAAIASISTIGAAAGKVVNGFVCQILGSRRSLMFYLVGLSIFTTWFAKSQNIDQLAFSILGMEFFASIMWTASVVLLATHYEKEPKHFAVSVGYLSLSSTVASLIAKFGLSFLLTMMDWRILAKLTAGVSLLGAFVVYQLVSDSPTQTVQPQEKELSIKSIGSSFKRVTTYPLFWKMGIAHSAVFLVRTSDKVLGSFFNQVTDLPRSLCGGFTSSVTIGFALGAILHTPRINSLVKFNEKKKQIRSLYNTSIYSAIALSLCAIPSVQSSLGAINSLLMPMILALSTGAMATSVSYQFYSLPSKIAKRLGKNKAICLSLVDAIGFLFSALIWNVSSRIVGENGLFHQVNGLGWGVTWAFLAALLAYGGHTMMGILPDLMGSEDSK